jgi:predicted transcriptional regulator
MYSAASLRRVGVEISSCYPLELGHFQGQYESVIDHRLLRRREWVAVWSAVKKFGTGRRISFLSL